MTAITASPELLNVVDEPTKKTKSKRELEKADKLKRAKVKADKKTAEKAKAAEMKAEKAKAAKAKAAKAKKEKALAAQVKAEKAKAERAKAEEAKAEEAKAAKVRAEEAKVAKVKAEEAKAAADEVGVRYTIDELSAATRVSSRTIRFYQSKGALPKPTIKGRVAYYSDSHVERLHLIAKLQDQGLRIRAIRDVLAKSDRGQLVIGEWLGFKAALQTPWDEDRPSVLTEDELYELLGDRREGLIGQLLRLKVITKDRDRFVIKSPALVKIAMKLEGAGVDLETSVDGARVLRKHLSKAAGELTDHFFKNTSGNALGGAFDALRPAGLEAVQLIFAQEIEKALAKLVDSGKIPS